MEPTEWGWNAYEHSKKYIAVEFAQARLGNEITDAQIEAFCWYALEVVRPAWPDIVLFLINHSDLQAEKSDPFPQGAQSEAFKARVRGRPLLR